MRKYENALLILGVLLIVISTFLMVEGQILGDSTIPAAILLMLVGLSLTITTRRKAKLR